MQDLGGVTVADLLGPVKEMLYKLEIWDGASWINLNSLDGKHYLKKVSLKLGGAGASPDPVAGSWSAEVSNPDGIFHPFHPTSSYAGLFRVGRKVRISVGAKYAGTPYYWQRLIGYMDAPTFNHAAKTVTLKGADFMKRLADTALRSPSNYWGASAIKSSVETTKTFGSQLYMEYDALDTVAEENQVPNWAGIYDTTVASVADATLGSAYALEIVKGTGYAAGWGANGNIGAVTIGKVYEVIFAYKRTAGAGILSCFLFAPGTAEQMGQVTGLVSTSAASVKFHFTATASGNVPVRFVIDDAIGTVSTFRVDQFFFSEVTARVNTRYPMPAACNGVYYATLDGLPYWYGDNNRGWFYDDANQVFYFDDKIWLETGTNNLVIYYFTTQDIVNVLADVLAEGPGDAGGGAGLYANRAAALAAMDYTDPDIDIGKVWFEPGPALDAVRRICERCNYRFWFAFDGTPTFKPVPEAGSPVFTFSSPAHVQDPSIHQDLAEIRNRIVIEGIEQGAFSTAKDKKTSRWTGTAFNQNSIDEYLEHTKTIQNDLFQDQASIDAMAVALLAAFKDPKWYTDIKTPFNPVPVELGDTVAWPVELVVAPPPGEGPVIVELAGIIRDIDICGGEITYVCQITTAGEMEAHALLSLLHIDTEAAAPLLGDMVLASGEQPAEIAGADPEHELLSEMHPDTVPASPLAADVIAASGDPVRWRRLPAGSEGQVLKIVGGAPAWGAGGAGDMTKAIYDANEDGKVDQAENADTVDGKHASDFLEGIYDSDYKCLMVVK